MGTSHLTKIADSLITFMSKIVKELQTGNGGGSISVSALRVFKEQKISFAQRPEPFAFRPGAMAASQWHKGA